MKQTAERHPDCLSIMNSVYDIHIREKTQPTEEELLDLLRQFSKLVSVTFYVLDALDEAPVQVQVNIVRTLASLNVKLFITSRPMAVDAQHIADAHRFSIFAHDGDVELHTAREISRSPELCAIINRVGPQWMKEIAASITRKCGGMYVVNAPRYLGPKAHCTSTRFLHVSLQVAALQDCTSIYDVRETLQAFPMEIEDVYLQTWARILAQHPRKALLAQKVLLWVLTSSRSMTMRELQHAVATSPTTMQFDSDRIVEQGVLLGLCCGLVLMEDESHIVRLVRKSSQLN